LAPTLHPCKPRAAATPAAGTLIATFNFSAIVTRGVTTPEGVGLGEEGGGSEFLLVG
jgi:hypothetical protein